MDHAQSEAETFLRQRYGPSTHSLVPLRSGEWSSAFAFVTDDARFVARFADSRDDFDKDALVWRLAGGALAVPRVVEVGEIGEAGDTGGFFAVATFVEGSPLDDLTGPEMRDYLPALLATLSAMRAVDISAYPGFGPFDGAGRAPFASWRECLLDAATRAFPTNRIFGWRPQLEAMSGAAQAFDAAYARLVDLAPTLPDERHLLHGDLLNRNVLVHQGRVSVIDWGNALFGDPVYDIAWLHFWAPWYPQWRGIDFAGEAKTAAARAGRPLAQFEDRLRASSLYIGLDGFAYCAFRGREQDVHDIARRTLEFA